MYYVVPNAHVGLLYEDGVFKDVLQPGRHKLKNKLFAKRIQRSLDLVDTRQRSLVIKGQEILTRDKVAIRVLKLRELETLQTMSVRGARFVVGLNDLKLVDRD